MEAVARVTIDFGAVRNIRTRHVLLVLGDPLHNLTVSVISYLHLFPK